MSRFSFTSTIIEWRGPPPYFFARIPEGDVAAIRAAARRVSYGWGVVPVMASIAGVEFTTSLFPRDDGYLLPIKLAVRRQLALTAGDAIAVEMTV